MTPAPKELAKQALASSDSNRVTLVAVDGIALVLTYALSSAGLAVSLKLETPLGDLKLGAVTLDKKDPKIELGGDLGPFKASVNLDYLVSKSKLTVSWEIAVPGVPEIEGSKTIDV